MLTCVSIYTQYFKALSFTDEIIPNSLNQTLKKEGVELLGREINPPPLFPAEEEGPEII